MLITDLAATVTYVELCEEVRTMCSVTKQQPITLKWIDDEGGCASQSNVVNYSVLCLILRAPAAALYATAKPWPQKRQLDGQKINFLGLWPA